MNVAVMYIIVKKYDDTGSIVLILYKYVNTGSIVLILILVVLFLF
jgi:hypothetical protein